MSGVGLNSRYAVGLDADIAAIQELANTDGNFIVGNGSTWVAESGTTARTSLGLGTEDSPTFANMDVNGGITANLVRVKDLGGTDYLYLSSNSSLTANKSLYFDVGNLNRTLHIEAAHVYLDQDYRTNASPSFAGLTLTGNLSMAGHDITCDDITCDDIICGMLNPSVVNSSLVPADTLSYNLGSSNYYWSIAYIDDIDLHGSITMDAGETVDGIDISVDVAANTTKVTESTTVTAPLVKTGYDISIPVATTSADGYLCQTDWDTFNDYVQVGHLPLAGGTVTGTLDLNAQLDLDYVYDAMSGQKGIDVVIENQPDQAVCVDNQIACFFDSKFTPISTYGGLPNIYGCYGGARITRNNLTFALQTAGAYYGSLSLIEGTDGGATTLTAGYGLNIAQTIKDAADTITTLYGIYVGDQSAGSTPYAIYTAGDVPCYFTGDITAKSYADNTPAFFGKSKDALDSILAITKNVEGKIDHSSLPEFARGMAIEQRPTGKRETIILPDGSEIEVDITEPVEVPTRNIGAMVTLLVEAIKEQQKQIEVLKAERRVA